MDQLTEGVSTESDVRARLGPPENIWDEPGGARTLEYNRNPEGRQNYMITIGPDGTMSALRQVLTPANFTKVQPGMKMEEVRRLLGKPARRMPFAASREEAWDWRWLQPPASQMIFTVWFDSEYRVLRSGSSPDPMAEDQRER